MKKKSRSKLVITIVALIEIIAIAAGVTFAWMEGGNRGKIVSPELTISTGSDLTMIYNGTKQSAITIPAANLEEVSSADGRNFFFPLGNNTSSQTAQMKFREGTEADMQKYIVLDFDLVASGAGTSVYLGADTGISTQSSELNSALRMAFLTNDQETPVVFAPTQMPGYYHNVSSQTQQTFSPIAAINADGSPASMATVATAAYGDFHYHGSHADVPIFVLNADERKHITLVIWLEGTEFNSAAVADKDLNINISFTTNVNDLQKINFYDNTHGYGGSTPVSLEQWVKKTETYNGHTYNTMMYVYANGVYYAMFRPDENDKDSWSVYIPNTLTSFTFRRYSPAAGTWWNEWNPYFTQEKYVTDANGEHTFVAVCGNGTASGTLLSGCYGYWKNSTGTYRIYYKCTNGWIYPYCYTWTNQSGIYPQGAYPGTCMTLSHKELDGEWIYYIDLQESDNITGIKISCAESSNRQTKKGYCRAYVQVQDIGSLNWGDTRVVVYGSDHNAFYTSDTGNSVDGNLQISFDVPPDRIRYGNKIKIRIQNGGSSDNSYTTGDLILGAKTFYVKYSNSSVTGYYSSDSAPDAELQITNSDWFFNGFACWGTDSEKTTWIYWDQLNSLIYPNNS